MDDQVLIAAGQNYWYQDWKKEELLGPLPPPPEFPESIEAVRERIAKVIGKVTVPREVRVWHPYKNRRFCLVFRFDALQTITPTDVIIH
jgi:hypothetical protein